MDRRQVDESPPMPKSVKQVTDLFGYNTTDEPTKISEEMKGDVSEIRRLKQEMKVLKEREDYLKDKIASVMLTSPRLADEDGIEWVSWKVVEAEVFDAKAFRKDFPLIAEKYMIKRPSRPFKVL